MANGKPGRPKGLPKTGGRAPGTPNKATAELKEIARQYTGESIEVLVKIMRTGTSEQAQIAAAREILDRGYGRPSTVIAGEDEAPLRLVTKVLIAPLTAD